MTDDELAESKIIVSGMLGAGNLGNIGPNTAQEAANINDCADGEYLTGPVDESCCMDDRGEKLGIQLAGNRATTEVADDLMDPDAEELPLSQSIARKTQELNQMGRLPRNHKGCAALLALSKDAAPLGYNVKNIDLVADLALTRLRLLGIDTVSLEDIKLSIETGGTRAAKKHLYDCTPEQVIEIATQNGAIYEEFDQPDHAAAGTAWILTEKIFDNGAFRRNHQTEEGTPQGVLVLSLGAYKNQLQEDGFADDIVTQKIMRATLFAIGVLKLAEKPDTPDVIIGYSS